jgi:hypothetical protein
MSTSRLRKIEILQQLYSMHHSGSGRGLHGTLRDGFLHEIGHLVCLGVTPKELVKHRKRHSILEWIVEEQVKSFANSGGNPDNDECRTVAACVYAIRQLRRMRDTKEYVKSSLTLASDLMRDSKSAPTKVRRSLATKVAQRRGRQILNFVDQLYELEQPNLKSFDF